MLINKDILKKLRVESVVRNDDIIKIIYMEDGERSKGEVGDLVRNEDHPGSVAAVGQILRNFLNGLIIYNRGKLATPKPGIKDETVDS